MLRHHPVLGLATFGYLAVVAWVTLGPQPLDREGRGLLLRGIRWFNGRTASEWLTYERVEFAANVLMFVPIGLLFLLLLGRRRWWLAIAFGVALTVGIEATQLFLGHRYPDPRDLLANSLGAGIGVIGALVLTWPKARALRRQAHARRTPAVLERV